MLNIITSAEINYQYYISIDAKLKIHAYLCTSEATLHIKDFKCSRMLCVNAERWEGVFDHCLVSIASLFLLSEVTHTVFVCLCFTGFLL